MLNKILCLFNVLFALNVEGMHYIIKRFVYSIDDFDQFIINVCERLKNKNVFYIKAIQAASSNNELFSKVVRDYMRVMADQVPYKSEEYNIDKLKNILNCEISIPKPNKSTYPESLNLASSVGIILSQLTKKI